MIKIKFVMFCLTCVVLTVSSQNFPKDHEVRLLTSPTSQTMTLTIHSEKESLINCQFKIVNLDGKIVKTGDLPEANNSPEISITIEDLLVGEYSFIIVKENKDLFAEQFIRDIYDEL